LSAAAAADPELVARYRAIVDHAELELELAGRGELDALDELGARWPALIAGLPARPPAEAAPLLERALLIHERTRIELLRMNEALLADLEQTKKARRTAEGYAGHLPARPRLDRSA
jgi:hypothetical protein